MARRLSTVECFLAVSHIRDLRSTTVWRVSFLCAIYTPRETQMKHLLYTRNNFARGDFISLTSRPQIRLVVLFIMHTFDRACKSEMPLHFNVVPFRFSPWHRSYLMETCTSLPELAEFTERFCITTHYTDVIMGMITSQITSLTIVYSTVYSDADQRKYQSSASLAIVRRIHRRPVNSPHKWPVTRKMFPFDDVIMPNSMEIFCSHRDSNRVISTKFCT